MKKWIQSVSRVIALVDQRPMLVLPVWIAAYVLVFWRAASRPFWYDELFSYYTSLSPSFERFIYCILHIDLHPPLQYFFIRLSVEIFGDTPFAVRLPFLLAFLVASLVAFRLVTERWGGALGLVTLGFFWSLSFSTYAVEARPYAILLAFFSLATLCWLRAAGQPYWTRMHTGLVLSLSAMVLTHCFSPTLALALMAGEAARTIVERKIDKRTWVALLAPLSLVAIYIPLVRNAQALAYPAAFHADPLMIPYFYYAIAIPLLPVIGILFLLVLWATIPSAKRTQTIPVSPKFHEMVFCVTALLSPALIICYTVWSGVPFWLRYGVGSTLPAAFLLTLVFSWASRRNTAAALAMAVLILALFVSRRAGTNNLMARFENVNPAYRTVHSQLPFVAASGLAFLELDHNESDQFTSRLFYLTDLESAIRYAHASIFEGCPVLKRTFPVRANVQAYNDFVMNHHQFLVLGTPKHPEDWLLEKLRDDGGRIELIMDGKFGYRDQKLFIVTMDKALPRAD